MKTMILAILISFLLTSAVTMASSPRDNTVVLGTPVPVNQQISMDKIDHSAWNALLKKYVDQSGQVNYQAWKDSKTDILALDRYLNTLSTAGTKVTAKRNAQLAFWINAYNAVTVKGILREYPTTSIRNHTAKLFGYNIWKNLLLVVGDTRISLDSIEHKVLRKSAEPRIHFAIVCASHSCPRLLNEAYAADELEQQLTGNTKQFFANSENFQFDVNKNQFLMSSILDWFKDDFGDNQAERLKTIASYLPTDEARSAAEKNSVTITYLTYDWSLNEQRVVHEAKRR